MFILYNPASIIAPDICHWSLRAVVLSQISSSLKCKYPISKCQKSKTIRDSQKQNELTRLSKVLLKIHKKNSVILSRKMNKIHKH